MKKNLKPCAYKQSEDFVSDGVLFVERSGELYVVARLSTRRYEAEGKPSLNRASLVTANRPETG